MNDPLPYLTSSLPGTGGVLRASLEDFLVEEIPAYEPTGEGEHLYITLEKRGITTQMAVERVARALECDPRDIGYAGQKDRHAVTVQTLSVPRRTVDQGLALALDGIRVLSAALHKNKLRTGHLRGNRFTLRVTGIADLDRASVMWEAIATVLQEKGVPNYYGEQRFGRDGDNAARGRKWLAGGPAPRQHYERKMLVSAVQSELFNAWLARRVAGGELGTYVEGDLAARGAGGRPWAIDPSEAPGFYTAGEVSPTGPMFGPKMLCPTGEALRREAEVLAEGSLSIDDFARARDLAEGTRRVARIFPEGLAVGVDGDAMKASFTLPAGAYATVVMREFLKNDRVEG